MLKTQRANENTSNIFPVITISQLLSQSYALFNFGVENTSSCFCNVHVISGVQRAWGLRRRCTALSRHLGWVVGTAAGSCGRAGGSPTCRGAAVGLPGHKGGRQSPEATPGRCGVVGVKTGAASGQGRKLLSCLAPGCLSPKLCYRALQLCAEVPHRAYLHFSFFCFIWKEPGLRCRGADSDPGNCRELGRQHSISTSWL